MTTFLPNWKVAFFALFITLLFGACSPTKYLKQNEFLLEKNTIKTDNKAVSPSEFSAYIRQRPNKSILGIKLYVRIYNLVNPEKEAIREAKRQKKLDLINEERRRELKPEKESIFSISGWIRDIGEPPVVYDKFAANKTTRQFELYLKNKGYYYAQVTDTVSTLPGKKKRKAAVYRVKTGKPYVIEQINYQLDDSLVALYVLPDSVNRLINPGDRLELDLLQQERARITNLLKNQGYYYFSKQYIYYKIDTISLANYRTILTIGLKKTETKLKNGTKKTDFHKRYMINQINYYTNFQPKKVIQLQEKYYKLLQDTLFQNHTFYYDSTLIIRPKVLLQGQRIKRGFVYNPNEVDRTYKYLSALSAYRLVNIEFYEPKELFYDSIWEQHHIKKLNCNINLTPTIPQSITLELEGTTASGIWGVAGNVRYRQKNLFKGSEDFRLKLKYEQEKNSNLEPIANQRYTTLEFGIQADISFPVFLVPFKFDTFNSKYTPITNVSFGFNSRSRVDYSNKVINGSMSYVWNGNNFLTHYLYPVDFYSTKLVRMDSAFVYYVKEQRAFERYFDHIISASRYTFIYNNQTQNNGRNYTYWRNNIETAGSTFTAFKNLTNAQLNKSEEIFNSVVNEIFAHIPNAESRTALIELVNNEISDKNESYYTLNNILYYQYWKFDTEFRHKMNLWKQSDFVYRVFLGLIFPYGNTLVSPIEKQYSVGGANSLRGWRAHTIGPGTYDFANDSKTNLSENFNMQFSDLKIELNLEYRFNIFWMVKGATFIDAGNIWSIRDTDTRTGGKFEWNRFYNQFAVNTGLGLRFDLSFFIFRLDVGVPLLDPKYADKWYWKPNRFGFSNFAYNFGIGYPF